jgi:hypothetical protein
MPYLDEIQVLGVKTETTQNTQTALGVNDYLQAPTTYYEPDVEEIKRDFARQSMDSVPSIRGRAFADVSYKIPMKGSGVAGTAWAPLDATLQACGIIPNSSPITNGINSVTVTNGGSGYNLPPTISFGGGGSGAVGMAVVNAGVVTAILIMNTGSGYTSPTVTITPVSGGTLATATATAGAVIQYSMTSVPASVNFQTIGRSCTVDLFRGATTNADRRVIKGAVGKSLKLEITAGGLAYLDVGMRGQIGTMANANTPSTTYNTTIEPICQSSALNSMGYSPIVQKISIDLGLKIAPRDDVNSPYGIGGFMVVGRDPKFSFDPELDLLTNQDFIAKMIAGTQGACGFRIGSVAGNTIWITMPNIQYSKVKFANRGGIMCYNIDGVMNQGTGDDSMNIIMV